MAACEQGAQSESDDPSEGGGPIPSFGCKPASAPGHYHNGGNPLQKAQSTTNRLGFFHGLAR